MVKPLLLLAALRLSTLLQDCCLTKATTLVLVPTGSLLRVALCHQLVLALAMARPTLVVDHSFPVTLISGPGWLAFNGLM
jgi:hypothetical protein